MTRPSHPSRSPRTIPGRFSWSIGLGHIRPAGYRLLHLAGSRPVCYELELGEDTLVRMALDSRHYPIANDQLYSLWFFHDSLSRWLHQKTKAHYWMRSTAEGLATDPAEAPPDEWRYATCRVKQLTLAGDPLGFIASDGDDQGWRARVYAADVIPYFGSLGIIHAQR